MLQHNSRKFSGGAYTGPYAQCYEWSQLLHHYLQNIEGEWEDAGRESLTTTILPTCSFPKPQLKMPRAATKAQHSQKQTKHLKKKKKKSRPTPAWRIPWMEETGRLPSMGSLRVGHDWATSHWFSTLMHWRRKDHSSDLAWRIPGTGGAWWAAIYGVTQSRTRLKWLSSTAPIVIFLTLNLGICLLLNSNNKKLPCIYKWLTYKTERDSQT